MELPYLVPRLVQLPADPAENDKGDQDFEGEEQMLFVHTGNVRAFTVIALYRLSSALSSVLSTGL